MSILNENALPICSELGSFQEFDVLSTMNLSLVSVPTILLRDNGTAATYSTITVLNSICTRIILLSDVGTSMSQKAIQGIMISGYTQIDASTDDSSQTSARATRTLYEIDHINKTYTKISQSLRYQTSSSTQPTYQFL